MTSPIMRAILQWLYRHSATMRFDYATREQYIDLAQQLHDATRHAMTLLQEMAEAHAKELKFEREMARKAAGRWKLAAALTDWEIMQRAIQIVDEREVGK